MKGLEMDSFSEFFLALHESISKPFNHQQWSWVRSGCGVYGKRMTNHNHSSPTPFTRSHGSLSRSVGGQEDEEEDKDP